MGLFTKRQKTLSCNVCGYNGDKFIKQSKNIYKCPACDALVDFGFSDEEQNLLSIAQSDLRRQEFSEAEEKFADIIEKFPNNHEAYWGYVCSRYGIKHEEDYNDKIIPTCCLDSITSFKQDNDFLKAVSLAPKDIADWYNEQADYIERISKKWIDEASKEEPYDIFICFKDSDKTHGIERTQDSIDASDLHSYLLDKGYRVFFSRISLQDKTGDKYEPFIFNALQTAKVMIVFGSKAEYIKSTWMKNEWHRYCKRISLGEKKDNSIVVAYKDFDINELPSILSSKQCLNFNSNKFYLNLQNYLDKFFNKPEKTKIKEEVAVTVESPKKQTIIPIVAGKKKEKKIFDEQHIHDYSITEVIPASCIARGYTIHKCECGDEYKDSFTPLAEHIFKLDKKIEPTCLKDGQEIYVCSVCGDKEIKPIKATGHNYGDWIIQEEPECEKQGVKAKQCENCGDVITEKIEPTGHTFGNWTIKKRPTCELNGKEVRQCKTCGKLEEREVNATGHNFSEWKLNKDGKTESRYCLNCGKDETRNLQEKSASQVKEKNVSSNIKAGNIIEFGSYPQGKNGEIKPIEWQVLSVENNEALLISKYGLDCKQFNEQYVDVTWETCDLRKWLNKEFYNKAFSESDKEKIILSTVTADKNPDYNTNQGNNTKDNVFLLSIKEVKQYFANDNARMCVPTDYAKKQGVWTNDSYKKEGKSTCWWWLRSSGDDSSDASDVYGNGSVYTDGGSVNADLSAVRPAIRIKV